MNASWQTLKGLFKKLTYVLPLISFLMLGSLCTMASPSELQQATNKVEGVVKDRSGEPLIGVSVVIRGTTIGTVTDVDGAYSLNLNSANPTLVFSYIGYASQSVVANKPVVNVVMAEDSKIMDEVVVVGFGSQKKVNLTGAVSTVDVSKTLDSRPIPDVGRGLQGAVAGLTITLPSGEVGSDPSMKIRGQFGSISGTNTSPLLLVDNVEIPSIQMINPDDIESISVLKDAASTSIYGAKGAFGVILITTKRGAKIESISVTYSNNLGWQNPAKKMEMGGLDAMEYSLLAAERVGSNTTGVFWKVTRDGYERAQQWQAQYGGTVKSDDPMVFNRDWYLAANGDRVGMRIYNPYDAMVREWAPSQNHNLSVNGRSGKTAYNIGLGYVGQNGMMKTAVHDDFKRYNVSVNVSTDINKYVTVRAGSVYSDRNKRYPASGATNADPWYYMYRWSPIVPIGVTEDGKDLRGPYYETGDATMTANIQNIYTNFNLGTTINLNKNWDVKLDYTYDRQEEIRNLALPTFTARDSWGNAIPWLDTNGNQIFVDDAGRIVTDGGVPGYRFPDLTYNPPGGANVQPQISRTSNEAVNGTLNIFSTYNLTLGNKGEHVFKFMGGMNRVTNRGYILTTSQTGLINFDNPQFTFATGDLSLNAPPSLSAYPTGYQTWAAQLGFFGRINYMFNDKYLLEANLRRDGSSNFPKELWWRWFPSFSGGWIVSNENFMKSLNPIVSLTKFRASWGTIGNQAVPNNLYVSTLALGQTRWLDAGGSQRYTFRSPTATQRDITWERIEHLNLGLDMRFFKDKVGFSAEYYQRTNKDMIIGGDDLPFTFGIDAPKGNFGEARTRGFEVTVDFNHRFSNGISINGLATFSDATAFITKGADYLTPPENRKIGEDYFTGRRVGDIYGYVTDRLYQKDDFVYNADGTHKKVTIIVDGIARETNMLAGANPNYQTQLEAGRFLFGPGDVRYADLNGDGNINAGRSTVGDMGDRTVIGNSTPRYEYGFRLGGDYKGFDVSVFFQGVGKRQILGQGPLAVPGFNTSDGAMPQAIAGDFWREDRTDAFYPRPWNLGGSNTGFNMQPQSRYLLDMSYLRVKNITFGYTVTPKVLKVAHLTKARFYVSLENFFTFDRLRGLPIDPEIVSGTSIFNSDNYNAGRTGAGTPTFKTASVGVQLSF